MNSLKKVRKFAKYIPWGRALQEIGTVAANTCVRCRRRPLCLDTMSQGKRIRGEVTGLAHIPSCKSMR